MGQEFIGKGFVSGGLFKFNVISDFHALNKNGSFFAYNVMHDNILHDRLGHVNKNTI